MVLNEKSLDASLFLVYMGLAYNILTPAKAISKASYGVKRGNAAAERVMEILNTESPLKDRPNAQIKTNFEKEITVNNINFKYEDQLVLKNFFNASFKRKNNCLGWSIWKWKIDHANLVTRFYDVNEGSINIDGTDIRDLTKHSLRGSYGIGHTRLHFIQ